MRNQVVPKAYIFGVPLVKVELASTFTIEITSKPKKRKAVV